MTLAEGGITELHVGLKGTMNALFLKDLAVKTHRGLRGRVGGGKSGGGLCYGYKVVKKVDQRGEPVCGDREIDEYETNVMHAPHLPRLRRRDRAARNSKVAQ